MKLPRRIVPKLSLATILAASASLGWATPEATAGKIPVNPDSALIDFQTESGNGQVAFDRRPNPSVIATVNFSGVGVETVAGIMAEYSFVVHGPRPADLNVQLSVSYGFSNLIAGQPKEIDNTGWGVDVAVSVNSHQILVLDTASGLFPTNTSPDAFESDSIILDGVAPDVVNHVSLFADIGFSDVNNNPKASGVAIADPVITFAPGFDSTGFSLEFSPGVGNDPDPGPGAATPEPSTLVLSSIVFGMWGIVWACRQRRRTRAAA